jgi:hypothetical protein
MTNVGGYLWHDVEVGQPSAMGDNVATAATGVVRSGDCGEVIAGGDSSGGLMDILPWSALMVRLQPPPKLEAWNHAPMEFEFWEQNLYPCAMFKTTYKRVTLRCSMLISKPM